MDANTTEQWNKVLEDNKPRLDEILRTREKETEKSEAFLKTIITIAAGMISVLVSLKGNRQEPQLANTLFGITISLLSSGILFGCILLYHYVVVLRKSRKVLEELLVTQLWDHVKAHTFERVSGIKFYKFYLFGLQVCFLLSLACLSIYAFIS